MIESGKYYFINDTMLIKVIKVTAKWICGYNILSKDELAVIIKTQHIKYSSLVPASLFMLFQNEKAQYLLAREHGRTIADQAKLLNISDRTMMRIRLKYDYNKSDIIKQRTLKLK